MLVKALLESIAVEPVVAFAIELAFEFILVEFGLRAGLAAANHQTQDEE